jgi:MFS family permease
MNAQVRHMERSWRWIYVVCAVLALYFNVFVAVVQSFLKIPAVHALAPTQKEPPFLVAQLVLMAIFVLTGIFAVKKFRIEPVSAQAAGKSSKAS